MFLEAVTNFQICPAERNILGTLSFCTQPRNGITKVQKFVNQYRFRFSKFITEIYKTYSQQLNVSDSLKIKLLTRLRLGFSYLIEHEFNQNSQDTVNPLCSCSLESESTSHFFLCCQKIKHLCKCLMNELIKIGSCIHTLYEKSITKLLQYGNIDMTANKTKVQYQLLSNSFILVKAMK